MLRKRTMPALILTFGLGLLCVVQDPADAGGKKKGKKKDDGPDPYQHIYRAIEQLRQARNALRDSIQQEQREGKIEAGVLKQLNKAVSDVNEAINHAEKAVAIDRKK